MNSHHVQLLIYKENLVQNRTYNNHIYGHYTGRSVLAGTPGQE